MLPPHLSLACSNPNLVIHASPIVDDPLCSTILTDVKDATHPVRGVRMMPCRRGGTSFTVSYDCIMVMVSIDGPTKYLVSAHPLKARVRGLCHAIGFGCEMLARPPKSKLRKQTHIRFLRSKIYSLERSSAINDGNDGLPFWCIQSCVTRVSRTSSIIYRSIQQVPRRCRNK